MNAELKMDKIFSQVQKLNKAQQTSLLKKLTHLLKADKLTVGKPVTLTDLSGLGSDIWRDTDIDKYVDDERQW
jgi:hypothetical protein